MASRRDLLRKRKLARRVRLRAYRAYRIEQITAAKFRRGVSRVLPSIYDSMSDMVAASTYAAESLSRFTNLFRQYENRRKVYRCRQRVFHTDAGLVDLYCAYSYRAKRVCTGHAKSWYIGTGRPFCGSVDHWRAEDWTYEQYSPVLACKDSKPCVDMLVTFNKDVSDPVYKLVKGRSGFEMSKEYVGLGLDFAIKDKDEE